MSGVFPRNVSIVRHPPADHPAAAATRADALCYDVTQPFIIGKEAFFERIVELCGPGPQAVLEPGCGPGGFLEFWIRRVRSGRACAPATLVGCDVSAAMIERAAEKLRPFANVPVRLLAGVDFLDPGSRFHVDEMPPGGFSLVVLSQSEHYAPNHRGSPLERRHAARGRRPLVKPELRRRMASVLRPGGHLVVIDDFRHGRVEEEAGWSAAWDRHVVGRFSDPAVVDSIRRRDPATSARIADHYAGARPEPQRLALARRARELRRARNWEETERLDRALEDFAAIFGAGNTGVMNHPDSGAHPQFFMLWGRRATAAT
jgi:SAM-dependent methyltransferase